MGGPHEDAKTTADEISVMFEKGVEKRRAKDFARRCFDELERAVQKCQIRSDDTTRALFLFGGAPVSLLALKAGASNER